jgi:hypothetical protein
MVWAGSKYFGIAKARTKQSQKIFIVAHYYPPGNVAGKFHEHVFPPMQSGGGSAGPGLHRQGANQFQIGGGLRKKSGSREGDSAGKGTHIFI